MSSLRLRFLIASGMLLSACTTLPVYQCAPNEKSFVNEVLYFGTGMSNGTVSIEQWTEFVNDQVTPRFPQGLTQWPASGQWRSRDGQMVQELSHVLTVDHPDDARSDRAVREIVELYKQKFRQEAVFRVRSPSCASF